MIWLTKVDGDALLLNEDHLVSVEGGHDSVLQLASGEKLRVQETPAEIARRIVDWRRRGAALDWLDAERETS